MIIKVLIFVTAFVLVSSEDHFGISSSFLHIVTPPKPVAFMNLGEYSGRTEKGIAYKKNYYFSKIHKSTWVEAKAICKSFDLELATFETRDEAQSFLNKIAKIYFFANFDNNYVLVDGITLTPKSTTDWYWTNSGEKIPYTIPWAQGEPNDAINDEKCLSIGRGSRNDTLGFNDHKCYLQSTNFVCQKTVII